MGKTYRNFKGQTYKPTSNQQTKNVGKDKFMGWTSGQHSHGDNSQPIDGEDYIKYGYPNDFRGKTKIIAQRQRAERKAERLIILDEMSD